MIIPILYGLLGVILACLYLFLTNSTNRKLPTGAREAPQEPGLPIIGIVYKIKAPFHQYLRDLGKKLGPLFRIKMGMREIFILNDYQTIKMCLKDDSENFSGRWNGNFTKNMIKNSGILLIDGEVWSRQRSFMLRILRDFGLGNSRTDKIVQNECRELLKILVSREKEGIDFSEIIIMSTINIISEFLMKKRYDKEDKDVVFLKSFIRKILSRPNLLQILHIAFPQLDNSSFLSDICFKLFFKSKDFDRINGMFTKEIAIHRELLKTKSEGEDFMDMFLLEQSREKEKHKSVNSFTDYQLTRTTFEMFAAGFDSTSLTLVWSLLFLSKYQDIQEKMHMEIIDFLGTDKMPSMDDKKHLPFTEAIMDETLRLSSAAPLAVFHRNLHDTVIDGIFIPRNSFIMPNLYACHRDTGVWEKPFEFYPEHFLSLSDDGTPKYRPRAELIAFSMGKRQCLGETLARSEFFIFLTSIIQQFRVRFADEITEDAYQEALIGDQAPIRYPKIKTFTFERFPTA